jgi:DNA-binding CsgD family transcriptional regulator
MRTFGRLISSHMSRATIRVEEELSTGTRVHGSPVAAVATAVVSSTGRLAETGGPDESLSPDDCRKLLRVSADLFSVEELSSLPQQLLRGLSTVIPHEFGGCHLLEPSRHHIAACYEPQPGPLPTLHKDFWRLTEAHPLNPLLYANPARAWKLSDVMSRRAFHDTEFYHALYRPLGVDCELVALLPDHPGTFLLISLHRRRTDFTERDRTALNLLLPHIAQTRERLAAAAVAENAGGPAPEQGMPEDPTKFQAWISQRAQWQLTPRETEVLFWLCQGKTNSEIGRILGIAERTAETHALRIYPKMGVENRYTAIATLSRLSHQLPGGPK